MKKALPLSFLLVFILLLICIVTIRHVGSSFIGLSSLETNQQHTYHDKRDSSVLQGKLNINTATAEELVALPGIGDVLAQRIIIYRQTHGSFEEIDELIHVKGIGEACLRTIRDYITIGD